MDEDVGQIRDWDAFQAATESHPVIGIVALNLQDKVTSWESPKNFFQRRQKPYPFTAKG
jgi:hypothetical protein